MRRCTPCRMRCTTRFEQFKAFPQDGVDNQRDACEGRQAHNAGLALGAEKSYGLQMKADLDQSGGERDGGW